MWKPKAKAKKPKTEPRPPVARCARFLPPEEGREIMGPTPAICPPR